MAYGANGVRIENFRFAAIKLLGIFGGRGL